MRITSEQARALLAGHGVHPPGDELDEIALRISTWLTALEEIERELGQEMNEVDPIPPVHPRDDFCD